MSRFISGIGTAFFGACVFGLAFGPGSTGEYIGTLLGFIIGIAMADAKRDPV